MIPKHPLLVRAVAQALRSIFVEKRHADKVIEQALRQNTKAGSHDRAFIAETTYEVLRYYRLYCEMLGATPRLEADFWQLVGVHFVLKHLREVNFSTEKNTSNAFVLPPWQEFKGLNISMIAQRYQAVAAQRAIRESIPDWMDACGAEELPEHWDATLQALNQPARVVLRSNRIRTDRASLKKLLYQEGIETEAIGDGDALVLQKRQNVFKSKAFQSGHFEMQDYSSQLVAPLLDPQPGMRVVDACAGGGGKTLHLAALLQNKGNIIAMDTVAWKLDELKLRARRAGATNIETRTIENRKNVKRLYESADRLLLDVPCSGLGVLRRNPDAKWKLEMAQIEQLRATQREILQEYSPIVKVGGRVVYATCSILPSENNAQVQWFLASEAGKDFRLLQDRAILPQEQGFDGFYMALLERMG